MRLLGPNEKLKAGQHFTHSGYIKNNKITRIFRVLDNNYAQLIYRHGQHTDMIYTIRYRDMVLLDDIDIDIYLLEIL